MRALLDVNVLIALLDADHVSHAAALKWFASNGRTGWASCPIAQNGCVRIMSHAGYPNTVPPQLMIERLAAATESDVHEFWPD
jgi:predicted nucleic acid-binding protein